MQQRPADNNIYIYGKHSLREAAMYAPQAITKIFLASYFDDMDLLNIARKTKVEIEILQNNKLPKDFDGTVAHQGVIVTMSLDKLLIPYKDFISKLEVTPDKCLVVLGELQDPQNVGAVIRSAAAFGIAGVLIPEHNQAPVNGAVVKVSAGMAFRVPLVTIGNVNNAVRDLRERGFWIYGLEGGAKHTVTKESYDRASVFILGNESTGIRQKTAELCDKLLSIPISARCESLNAAASAAVTLYSWSEQHPDALEPSK